MTDRICAACGANTPLDLGTCATCAQNPDLRGRYTLETIVGHGAVGTTYRARDGLRGETVAVKEMPLRPTTPADQVTRIEREARVLGELHHDRIPAHIEHFAHGQGKHRAFYLVQQFIDGPTLADEIKRKRYTEDEVLAVLDEICTILDYLHRLAPPVVHRDLKPKNLIRRPDGALVLIDFGAVRDVVADPAAGGSTVAGTYGYMAPEQFRGEATPQSDLYSLGAIAVQMLSRRDLVDLAGVDHRLDWEKVVHASDPTRALLRRLLAPDPTERPATARAVREAIARIRSGEATDAPAPRVTRRSSQTSTYTSTHRTPSTDRYRPPPMPQPDDGPRIAPQPVFVSEALRRRMGAREKKWAILLALLTGFWGGHNLYLQRYLRFGASLLFCWTWIPLIFSLVDAVRIFAMTPHAFDEKFNPELMEYARGDTLAVAEQIKALHQLVDQGALTEEEFQDQKAILLQQRAPNTFSRLSRDALEMVFDHFGDRHDLPAELADQLKKSRHHLESRGWIRRQSGSLFAGPDALRPNVQTIIHPAPDGSSQSKIQGTTIIATHVDSTTTSTYRSTRYRSGAKTDRHRTRSRDRDREPE